MRRFVYGVENGVPHYAGSRCELEIAANGKNDGRADGEIGI